MAKISGALVVFALMIGNGGAGGHAQSAPASPDRVWHSKTERDLDHELALHPEAKYEMDAKRDYTLGELIDLAQQHNPVTRVAWEEAKAKAASLGIARGALFPTIAAVALASTARQAPLIGEFFHRQTIGLFEPTVHVEYLVFDFGGRGGAIEWRRRICWYRISPSTTPTARSSSRSRRLIIGC